MVPPEDDLDFVPPPSLLPPRGVKRVVAVGGGRGGAGKSLLTVNLSVYMAQLGRSVVVVDADASGANLHAMLGLDGPPTPSREQVEAGKVNLVETTVPGLRLMGAVFDPTALSAVRPGRRAQWSQLLRQIDCDYIVIDLGPGVSPGTLDLFAAADVGICVTVPEPPAIEATYRFLRALFLRRLRRALTKERFKLRLVERSLGELGPLPTPLEVIHALGRYDVSLVHLASSELRRTAARLVVNATRVRSDVDVGPSMQAIADRFLGIDLDYTGHIEQDDAVWLTVRRRRPLLIDSPTSKSARNIERIARRVVALMAVPEVRPTAPPSAPEQRRYTLYDVLGLSRGASDEEVRRAHKRQRELFSPGSLPLWSILDGGALRAEQAKVEEAHDTLLEPIRRRAYDLSTFPDEGEPASPPTSIRPRALSAERSLLQAEIAREVHSATEFSGAFLRKIRESQGVELADIAAKTKIALAHLKAIEDERFAELPAAVYARGFVREIAKILRLDPAQVDRTYLRRMREGLAARGRPSG